MWHKTDLMRHQMRLTLADLIVKLANHYSARGAHVLPFLIPESIHGN